MKQTLLFFAVFLLIVHISCDRFQRTDQYSKHGKTKKTEYIVNKKGDSILVNYRSDGTIESSITVKNKRRNGIAYVYYPNGKVQFEIMYKDGFKHGLVKYFYESGKIYRETTYVNGQIDGIQRKYYENGKTQAEIPYRLGQVQMGTKEFTSSGRLITDYPKIVVAPIDKMAFENTYYLKIYLKPKKSRAHYFINKKIGNIEGKTDLDNWTTSGVAKYPVKVYPGQSIMNKLDIRAQFKTRKGNPKIIRKIFNLAVENRNF